MTEPPYDQGYVDGYHEATENCLRKIPQRKGTMIQSMMDDTCTIKSISIEGYGWTAGYKGVVKIEPCREYGEMGYVPWFAIYWDAGKVDHGEGQLVTRINGRYVVEVDYFLEPTAANATPREAK